MGTVVIQERTCKDPITLIGEQAGVCYGADLSNQAKNISRGLECIESGHGRTVEFPDVYMILDGWSARVIREWYTHIGGMPTRLQASTRYIDYEHGFKYVTPPSIYQYEGAEVVWSGVMDTIQSGIEQLDRLGVPREDCAMALPMAMETKVVCKHNLRHLIEMSHTRMCGRAYHEFRSLFQALCNALREYSPEWTHIVNHFFKPNCEFLGRCPEKKSCGYWKGGQRI